MGFNRHPHLDTRGQSIESVGSVLLMVFLESSEDLMNLLEFIVVTNVIIL